MAAWKEINADDDSDGRTDGDDGGGGSGDDEEIKRCVGEGKPRDSFVRTECQPLECLRRVWVGFFWGKGGIGLVNESSKQILVSQFHSIKWVYFKKHIKGS